MALRPAGPYPVLALHGEQGSGKSTAVEVLRSIIDPNEAALRPPPRDERDLVLAASNGYVVALERVDGDTEWPVLADANGPQLPAGDPPVDGVGVEAEQLGRLADSG
jgi:hypothetical protein